MPQASNVIRRPMKSYRYSVTELEHRILTDGLSVIITAMPAESEERWIAIRMLEKMRGFR